MEKFLGCGKVFDCGIVTWLWNISLAVEKFLDCGKVPWLEKSYLTAEKFLDCGKITFFTEEKITDLIILKAKLTLKPLRYILSLEQKCSSLAFFSVDKISSTFSRRLKHKY